MHGPGVAWAGDLHERAVPPELEGIVARAWYLEMPPIRRYEKILPLPFMHLIVNLSEPYRLFDQDGSATVVSEAFLSGLQSEYLVIESPPLIRHVGLELTPVGPQALAPDAVPTSVGHVQDARIVLEGVDDLAAALRGAEPETTLVALLAFATAARRGEPDTLITGATEVIGAAPHAPIGSHAARLGVSASALATRFRRVTGTTPKIYAQVLRFHRLIDSLAQAHEDPDWASLAAASGYYDQPHVIRAFRRFSGWTPVEYRRLVAEHGPDAAHFVPLEQLPTQARV